MSIISTEMAGEDEGRGGVVIVSKNIVISFTGMSMSISWDIKGGWDILPRPFSEPNEFAENSDLRGVTN